MNKGSVFSLSMIWAAIDVILRVAGHLLGLLGFFSASKPQLASGIHKLRHAFAMVAFHSRLFLGLACGPFHIWNDFLWF